MCVGGPCFEGVTDLNQACCASTLTSPGTGVTPTVMTPDLTTVNIADDPSCTSSAARFVANGICLGKEKCTFHLDNEYEYTWEYQEKYDTVCDEAAVLAEDSPAGTCTRRLTDESEGTFEECGVGMEGGDKYELIVVGVCGDEFLEYEVPEWIASIGGFPSSSSDPGDFSEGAPVRKSTVVKHLAYIDSFSVVLFLAAVYWLQRREKSAMSAYDDHLCSPSDFTVLVWPLPAHENLERLKEKLVEHFANALKVHESTYPDTSAVETEDLSIFDINFACTSRSEITLLKTRGNLARLKDKLENKAYWREKHGKFDDEVRRLSARGGEGGGGGEERGRDGGREDGVREGWAVLGGERGGCSFRCSMRFF